MGRGTRVWKDVCAWWTVPPVCGAAESRLTLSADHTMTPGYLKRSVPPESLLVYAVQGCLGSKDPQRHT